MSSKGGSRRRVARLVHDVRDWFERRSYGYARFADPVSLAERKRELGLSISILLTCSQITQAVRTSIDAIRPLGEQAPLADQISVIAASPSRNMDAVCPGAEVYCGDDLMPEYGLLLGKGDAMWRGLSIARGDLVVYADVEAPAFEPHFVCGVLGPLLSFPRVRFAKAAYEYPLWGAQDEAEPKVDEALAELMARPLINLYYPELSGFSQPLSGEFAAPRELLCSIPFFTGYATEMTIMIDLLHKVGLDAMVQVNFGRRWGRRGCLVNPGFESYAMLRAVDLRLGQGSSYRPPSEEAHPRDHGMTTMVPRYTCPVSSSEGVQFRKDTAEIAERPPMARVLHEPTRATRSDRG
jgi:glucosyl-3-phosphoglycerate synthase